MIASCASVDDVRLSEPGPDVLVLDLYLGRDDLLVLDHIPALVDWAGVVVLHTAEEKPVPRRRALARGVHGVILKNDGADALISVIRSAVGGDFACSSVVAEALTNDRTLTPRLTSREVEVLSNLRDGLTQRQVGSRLKVAEETLRAHLKSIREKYVEASRDVTNTSSLVREAGRAATSDRAALSILHRLMSADPPHWSLPITGEGQGTSVEVII